MFLFSLSASHGSQTIKEHLQHLDAINIILTSLLNMKSRHLRTKNPLSNEVVQGLRKVPEVHNIGLKHTTLERASATNQKLWVFYHLKLYVFKTVLILQNFLKRPKKSRRLMRKHFENIMPSVSNNNFCLSHFSYFILIKSIHCFVDQKTKQCPYIAYIHRPRQHWEIQLRTRSFECAEFCKIARQLSYKVKNTLYSTNNM